MDFSGNREALRHGEHEVFVANVKYQRAKRYLIGNIIEVCATYIQEELEGKGSIATLEKNMEEHEKWSQELKCAYRTLVDRLPRATGEFKSIVQDRINFGRLHKKMVYTARRLIKKRQPQHTHTHTEDGTSGEKVSVSENVRNISSEGKIIHSSVNWENRQPVDRDSPTTTQRKVEMQGSWGGDVELPVSGTVTEWREAADGIDASAAEQSSRVENAEQRLRAGSENCVRACVSPGVTSVSASKSASASAIEQLQVQLQQQSQQQLQMQQQLQHQQQLLQQQQVIQLRQRQQIETRDPHGFSQWNMQAEESKLDSSLPIVHGRSMSSGAMGGGQSRHHVHSTVNGLGDGHCNRTRISHMATLLGVAEVAVAALLVLVYTAGAVVGVSPAAKQPLKPHHAADTEADKDNYQNRSKFSFLGWDLEKVSESTEVEMECKNDFFYRNWYKGKSRHPPDGLVIRVVFNLCNGL